MLRTLTGTGVAAELSLLVILGVRISSRSRGTIKLERQRKASRFIIYLVNPNESWRSQDSNNILFYVNF